MEVQSDPWHMRIKEHLKTRASSSHKHLIKCINNDNNFFIKIEVIVRDVGSLGIKEALLIASYTQYNRLQLNTG